MTTNLNEMSETKTHTPGPWNMIEARTLIHIETDANHLEGAGIPICSLPKKSVANAALIAAAPDLLEALIAVLNTGLNGGNTVRLAYIAASQKALTDKLLAEADLSEHAVKMAREAIAKASN